MAMERCCIESLALKGIADGFAVTPEGGVWTCDVCGRHYQIVRGQWSLVETRAGQYLERDWTGRLIDTTRRDTPDVVICRRVVDYAPSPVPPTAAIGECSQCGAAVTFNPANPHSATPKICMQCGGIEPLPIES